MEGGKKGQYIQRYKGLGEMNPAQLVGNHHESGNSGAVAGDASRTRWKPDEIFSTLMGDEVEPRRKFIEEHALTVKNSRHLVDQKQFKVRSNSSSRLSEHSEPRATGTQQVNSWKRRSRPQKVPVYIEEEMRESFMAYAMSVIISRALPDVRDGLEAGAPPRALRDVRRGQYVGQAVQEIRPSWSAISWVSIIPTATRRSTIRIVRMAQDFNHALPAGRRPGQFRLHRRRSPGGRCATRKFGMAPLAEEMLADIEKETVDFSRQLRRLRSKSRRFYRRAFPTCLINGVRAASPSAWRPTFRRTI